MMKKVLQLILPVVLATTANAASLPEVFWSSSPVLPSETALLGTTTRASSSVQISQASDPDKWIDVVAEGLTDDGLSVEIPDTFEANSGYYVRVTDDDGSR